MRFSAGSLGPGSLLLAAWVSAAACTTSGDVLLGSRAGTDASSGGAVGSSGGAPSGGAAPVGGLPGGLAGAGGAEPLPCLPPGGLPAPLRRFDFEGAGTEVVDRQGGASAEVVGGAALSGDGSVLLDGVDDFVDLPNDLFGDVESATVLLWVSVFDGPAYWRIFDFGTSDLGEDPSGYYVGTSYVALTTETGLDPTGLAFLVAHGGVDFEDRALTSLSLVSDRVAFAAVIDGPRALLSLYVDGRVVAEAPLTGPLSEIPVQNAWLGRSQYSADPYYPGRYDEVRIYAEALSGCAVTALSALGPDDPG